MTDLTPWLSLAIAMVLAALTGGRWNVPIAAWLGPAFMLYFVHAQSPVIGYLAGTAALCAALFIAYRGVAPLPLPFYLIFVLLLAASWMLPYLVDRLWGRELPILLAPLLFPMAVVALEILSAALSPYGTWGGIAYTQYGSQSLMQTASLWGGYGISFLVAWFGSTLAWVWGYWLYSPDLGLALLIYFGVLLAALFYGGIRLAVSRQAPTVKIAGIVEGNPESKKAFARSAQLFMGNDPLDENAWASLGGDSRTILEGLLAATEREAKNGAKIILWSEAAGVVTKEDEPAHLERARELAKTHQIYFAMALATLHRESRKLENKIVMVTPEGEIAWQYHKARLVPGIETLRTQMGDSSPRYLDTPYGRLGAIICFDADFPYLSRRMGRLGVDILLVPSSDWKEIDPVHSQMAVFRGLENGCSVIRPVRAGYSLAADPYGRILAAQDYFTTQERMFTAHVPTRGVRTAYSRLAPFWIGVAVSVFIYLLLMALYRSAV